MQLKRSTAFALIISALACARAGAAPQWNVFPYGGVDTRLGGIVSGPDGNLWFADTTGDALVRMTTAGAMRVFPLSAIVNGKSVPFAPQQLTVGADGRFYIGGCTKPGNCSYLVLMSTTGVQTSVDVGSLAPGWVQGGLTLGSNGQVWFPGRFGYGEIATTGAVTTFYHSGSQAAPSGAIAATPGNIWITESPAASSGAAIVLDINENNGAVVGGYQYCQYDYRTDLGALVPAGASVYAACGGSEEEYYHSISSLSLFGPQGNGGLFYTFIDYDNSPSGFVRTVDGLVWSVVYPQWLSAFDPINSSITTHTMPQPQAQYPGSITIGPDGNIWFVDNGVRGAVANIVEYVRDDGPSARGRRTVQPLVRQRGAQPPYWVRFFAQTGKNDVVAEIVPGPDARMWYTEAAVANSIFAMNMEGTVTPYQLTWNNHAVYPGQIAVGADDKLYIAMCFTGSCRASGIGVMTTRGDLVVLRSPSGDGPGQNGGIGLGPDGNIWVGERKHLARITPAGDITEFPYPGASFGQAISVTAVPSGSVWFVGSGGVTSVDPSTGAMTTYRSPCVAGITYVRGFLYAGCATENGALARITTSGTVSLLPNPYSGTIQPVAGPGNNVWLSLGTDVGETAGAYSPTTNTLTALSPPNGENSFGYSLAGGPTGTRGSPTEVTSTFTF